MAMASSRVVVVLTLLKVFKQLAQRLDAMKLDKLLHPYHRLLPQQHRERLQVLDRPGKRACMRGRACERGQACERGRAVCACSEEGDTIIVSSWQQEQQQ